MMGFLAEDGPGFDFDDLYGAWDQVAIYQAEVDRIEYTLDQYRAVCKRQAYEQVPRPPMEYLKQVVHYVGVSDETKGVIDDLSETLVDAQEQLTKAKGRLDAMQNQIRVWQTMSANARKAVVVE
jgi:uncharacterized coiled-coil DUF342 family protein